MASKKRIRNIPPSPEPLEVVDEPIEQENLPANPGLVGTDVSDRSLGSRLKDFRTQVLQAKASVAHTIAELEAWRDEINDTIAFLRANR